jgi:ABC-type transporter Mla subunit MlaD
MSQASLADEDLFGEAAAEIRSDVQTSLNAAEESLPDAEEIWAVESDNTLGVLNGLQSALDPDGAREALREAKKWYTVGQRAEAFESEDDLAAAIDRIESRIDAIESAHENAAELAATIPELKSVLAEET